MDCDIRLRVSVTCTFTIKHGTHVPIVHVVTDMTRIDYNALLTPLIAKACVVQWIERRTPDSGADSSNHGVGRYFFFIYREVYRICLDFYLYSR